MYVSTAAQLCTYLRLLLLFSKALLTSPQSDNTQSYARVCNIIIFCVYLYHYNTCICVHIWPARALTFN